MSSDHEQDVNALNQDYSKYEQVEKKQSYRLAEAEGAEEFDEDLEIKTVDMEQFFSGGEKGIENFARELGTAMEEIGFVIITGHGIDPKLHEQTRSKVLEFFETTTVEQRMKYRAQRHGSVNQGYFPIKETSQMHPDLVEGWVFCRRAFDIDDGRETEYNESDFYPAAGFEPYFREHVLKHEKLFKPIMQSICRYLGCDPHMYDKKLTGTNFGFRLNYYPPIGEEEDKSGAGRILGHEDVDLFTILPAPDIEGLQAMNRKNDKWVRIEAPPGSIIINTGDYMQRITNNILPSTTHRVAKPRDKSKFDVPRISFPLNVYVWEDEMLEVLEGIPNPKYEPVKAVNFHTKITSKYYGDNYSVDEDKTD